MNGSISLFLNRSGILELKSLLFLESNNSEKDQNTAKDDFWKFQLVNPDSTSHASSSHGTSTSSSTSKGSTSATSTHSGSTSPTNPWESSTSATHPTHLTPGQNLEDMVEETDFQTPNSADDPNSEMITDSKQTATVSPWVLFLLILAGARLQLD